MNRQKILYLKLIAVGLWIAIASLLVWDREAFALRMLARLAG